MRMVKELGEALNGKRLPNWIYLLGTCLLLGFQGSGVYFGILKGQDKIEASQARFEENQSRMSKALAAQSAYLRDGVPSKKEVTVLWNRRARELTSIRMELARMRRGAAIITEGENPIDLPNWERSADPPSVWLEDKAGGRE